ncbi:MAG: PrsW family glutamic-type intramembrane protease [bacterium]|nr:PrsW family glutamic-type intramembrane protease [bacterium]
MEELYYFFLSILSNHKPLLYSLLGGVLPALIWLAFWIREDKKHPEPKGLIAKTFLLGMLAVLLVLPFQKAVDIYIPGSGALAFLIWAMLEETFKFLSAYFGGLRTKDDNEPLDPMIYMITAALGFAALENTLFILNPLLEQDILGSIVTGNLRFVGTTLLHTISSATIGITLALSFYRGGRARLWWGFVGFILAVVIHYIFNLMIRMENGLGTPIAFGVVWAGVSIVILFFERVKMLRRKR